MIWGSISSSDRGAIWLWISQIEIRDRTAAFRKLDLTLLAHEVVESFDAAAEEKGVALQASGNEAVFVLGASDLLFDAVSNLVAKRVFEFGAKPVDFDQLKAHLDPRNWKMSAGSA